jgi:hypothetical protein
VKTNQIGSETHEEDTLDFPHHNENVTIDAAKYTANTSLFLTERSRTQMLSERNEADEEIVRGVKMNEVDLAAVIEDDTPSFNESKIESSEDTTGETAVASSDLTYENSKWKSSITITRNNEAHFVNEPE